MAKHVPRIRKRVSNLAQERINPRLYGGMAEEPKLEITDPLEGMETLKQLLPNADAPRLKDTTKVIPDEYRSKNGQVKKGVPTAFKKGNRANPGGRPKGRSMTAMMNKMLERGVDRGDGQMVEFVQILIERGIAEAAKGNFKYWKEIFDRCDGKVAQRHEVALAIKAVDADTFDSV